MVALGDWPVPSPERRSSGGHGLQVGQGGERDSDKVEAGHRAIALRVAAQCQPLCDLGMPERDAGEHAIFDELDLLDEAEQPAVPVAAALHVGYRQLDVVEAAHRAGAPLVLDDNTFGQTRARVVLDEGPVERVLNMLAGGSEVGESSTAT